MRNGSQTLDIGSIVAVTVARSSLAQHDICNCRRLVCVIGEWWASLFFVQKSAGW